ncbi:MAG: butyrate kinase [Oscillospiraceae bacterium]|nr:butyrate kinase [Oscillospiraceae bacterium]
MYKIFVINIGSSSLKTALFEDDRELWSVTKRHDPEKIRSFARVYDQIDFRMEAIDEVIAEKNADFGEIDVIACRGGFCKPLESGTYAVCDALLDDLKHSRWGEHAANISPFCGKILSERYNKPVYYTDPVSVDEFMPESYITGHPNIRRVCKVHALNHKAVARYAARDLGKRYEDCNFIVAHMGGGITVAAHRKGRMVDACSPADEGPLCVDRPGQLPNLQLLDYIFSSGKTRDELYRELSTGGGLMAYTGMVDLIKIEELAATDKTAALVLDTMSYRISFYILGYMAAFGGEAVDAVVLTGGMAKSDWVVPAVSKMVGGFAKIMVYKGEYEMEALAAGAKRVVSGEEKAKVYPQC